MKKLFVTAADFFKKVSDAVYLFKGLWKEHTVALLNSPLDSDKTELIAEIIDGVTTSRQVLYVNTEHRADALARRFAENRRLMILTPAYDDPDAPQDYADLVLSALEAAIAETDIRTFIVDSVTRIAALSFGRNSSPAYIMKRLAALQSRHNLSLLVIAHTSTKSSDRALKVLSDCEIPLPQPESADTPQITETISPVKDTENSSPQTCAPTPKTTPKKDPKPSEGTSNHRPVIHEMFHRDSKFWDAPDPFRHS